MLSAAISIQKADLPHRSYPAKSPLGTAQKSIWKSAEFWVLGNIMSVLTILVFNRITVILIRISLKNWHKIMCWLDWDRNHTDKRTNYLEKGLEAFLKFPIDQDIGHEVEQTRRDLIHTQNKREKVRENDFWVEKDRKQMILYRCGLLSPRKNCLWIKMALFTPVIVRLLFVQKDNLTAFIRFFEILILPEYAFLLLFAIYLCRIMIQEVWFIGKHEHNRGNKLILEIELSKGVPVSFSSTRLIIFFLHADWLER